jgi:hypothetical protein
MLPPSRYLNAYMRSAERLQNDAATAAVRAWRALGSWRDDDVARFKRLIVPVVQGQQTKMASLTAAYQTQVNLARGDVVPRVLLDRAVVMEPRGIASAELYQRPANQLYRELQQGVPFQSALDHSATRLSQIVSTDMQLVKTQQSSVSLLAGGLGYFRRVLTGTEDCSLCEIASAVRYVVGDLMPVHSGCNCVVDAVGDTWSSAAALGAASLLDAENRIGSEYFDEFEDPAEIPLDELTSLVEVRTHSEIGPVLTWKSQNFTGPSES